MIKARPIRFTADIDRFRRLLDALGGTVVTEAPGWVVYAVGSGRVALHAAPSQGRVPGQTLLAFETPDLAAWAERARQDGLPFRMGQTDHGEAATVDAPDGTTFTVDPAPDAATADTGSPLAVLPIWYGPDTGPLARILVGVGARPRISSEGGGWRDFSCELGGLVAAHADDRVEIELGFEYAGDVTELVEPLRAAGFAATLIDEAYNRTLLVPDPERGAEVWINEQMTDLYGYHREQ